MGRLDRHPRLAGLVAALAAAGLFILAFPTTELGPLAFVALVPVLIAMRTRPRWQRLRLGWLMGFIIELALFRWIPFTMTEMTSIPEPLTWLMAVGYALWHGLRFGVFLLLAEPLRRAVEARVPLLTALAIAAFYAVIEWLWPVIFPWALGHAVWELPGAGALLALQGVPLLTFGVALVNAAIAEAWLAPRRIRDRRVVAAAVALGVLVALALALVPGEGERRLRVAILQPNYSLAEKKRPNTSKRLALLDRFEAQIRALAPDRYDLIVASEGSFPLWWRVDADDPAAAPANLQLSATRRIQRAIAEGPRAQAILGGLRQDEQLRTRNSAVHFGADGRIRGHYDKQTLVPFSEYMPLSDLFPALGEIRGIGKLTAGEAPCRFTVVARDGGAVMTSCGICYESLFAAATRRDAAEAELLANLTIDTWFGTSTAPRMHLMAQASRAAELGVPLLRSALTGISAYVDVRGKVMAELPLDQAGVLEVAVALGAGTTGYRALGQVVAPLWTGLSLIVLADAWRRRKILFPVPAAA